ncbi:MAG: hypothetical protein AAF354_07330 [Pseudomonadota bacterium]
MYLGMDQDALIHEIDDFLKRTGMTPTAFGRQSLNDGSFLSGLRNPHNPRSCTLKTVSRLRKFMADYEAESDAA